MTRLELPNGDVVDVGDVILFEGYPYRIDPDDSIVLSPVYWGGSALDLAFEDTDALEEEWSPESRGLLDEQEWERWLSEARGDDRFAEAEIDAIADVVLETPGLVDRVRRLLGFE